MATVDPQDSEQFPTTQLATGTVNFTGCKPQPEIPTITFKELQIVNYTIHTWNVDKAILSPNGLALATTTVSTSPLSAQAASWTAQVKTDLPPALVVEKVAEPINVTSQTASPDVGFKVTVTRGDGVAGLLYGLEGQVSVGSPTKNAMTANAIQVAIVMDSEDKPTLVPTACPTSANRKGGGLMLPAAPKSVTCSFKYNMTDPTPGAVTGVVVMDSASASSNNGGKDSGGDGQLYIGQTLPFSYSPQSGIKITVKKLGECAVATDTFGNDEPSASKQFAGKANAGQLHQMLVDC